LDSFEINKKQFLAGVLCLLAGVMEYLLARPVGSTYFLYDFKAVQSVLPRAPGLYGQFGGFAPEFFHPLAFSLISMALVSSRKARIVICISWFAINFMFELGQRCGAELAEYLPKWFDTLPVFGTLRIFFLNGRFDVYDLVAICLGSLTALLVGEMLAKKGGSNAEEHPKQRAFET
jgi:hypothetical protein